MSKNLTDELEYLILPGKPDFNYTRKTLHDQTFRFWQSFWMDVLKENGTTAKVNVDEFLRQDRVTVLRHRDEIVGLHTYTLFDLTVEAPGQHTYFSRFYNPEFIAAIKKKNVFRVMTMEYFSVHKDWRASKIGVSLATVLCSLGTRLGKELHADGIITAARSDNGAAHIATDLGAEALVKNIDIYNTPCDLMLFEMPKTKPPKDIPARTLAEQLWNRRTDTINDLDANLQIVA